MATRRGFLQTIGAGLSSTLLPGSTVASVLTAAPVASAAVGVATVAAVARQFKTSGALIDAATFEPKTWVAIFNPDGSVFEKEMMYSEILDDPARRAEAEELDKLYPNAHHGRRWSVLATRIILEKQGMPPLTAEEEIAILEGKKETV
ncbi:hypothetical protein UFOVP190_194 [uncultured Caudovirales phage]|uniref:Uncharacterized protein n=1 Tax=uncultured Caudovirales phage TaxID=2100421 RepID=A0A6J7WM26_9CAUD|nr:hypothetical protein UFOVP190_194 [uncultured Caudovirales phage]